jgi:hypothetical protein
MYYITTKGTGNLTLLGKTENRNDARAYAKANEGTVRTQAEYANLIADGRLPRTPVAAETGASQVLADEVGAEDPTDAEIEESNQPAANPFVALATKVNETVSKKNTLGKKEKHLKRVYTSAPVLAEAETYLRGLLVGDKAVNKVVAVRMLASWTSSIEAGVKLQRRDALALVAKVAEHISPATVSTQWQLVRSGKAA